MSSAPAARFAALRNPSCRVYLLVGMLTMMADNVEHVITYWVLWREFRSSGLVAFEVLSHWLPYLLFSVQAGALADRFDCRRVIQASQVMFMAASAGWAVLFLTGTLQVWNACLLLVLHGLAGCIWGPAEQLMLQDFVGDAELPSAVRLNATGRSLGLLFGPVVGSVLLLGLGPVHGLYVNVLIYLPMTLFLAFTPFTGHTRTGTGRRVRLSALDAVQVFGDVRGDAVLVAQIVLAGLASFFVGVSLQSTMPAFAEGFGAGSTGTAYGVLLFATGAGGVVGGLLLEVVGRIPLTVRATVVATVLFGAATLGFALTSNYVLAVVLLFVGGAANLAAMSIGQTMTQLRAPVERRGRVIGLYGLSANGLRFGSGITVGLFSGLVGVHTALAVSAAVMVALTLVVAVYTRGSDGLSPRTAPR